LVMVGMFPPCCPRYGLETMCIGGGQGLAAVFARIS
jgi:acetyl-CoA acetyltransferase